RLVSGHPSGSGWIKPSTAYALLCLARLVPEHLEVLFGQFHAQLRRAFKIFARLAIVTQLALDDASVVIRFCQLWLQLHGLRKILQRRWCVADGERRNAPLVIGDGIL